MLASLIAVSLGVPAVAERPVPVSRVVQLYSYRLTDAPRFRQGYRAHLGWHVRHRDRLVWYGWTVQAGPRRGLFIDGTAGATLADLDARPDPAGDGADFTATAATYAQPVDIETWQLWPAPTTATPLENRSPSAFVDVFLLDVPPGRTNAFEAAIERLAQGPRGDGANLTWYRKLRGGGAATHMILVPRQRWTDIDTAGGPLAAMLARRYAASPSAVDAALAEVSSRTDESWAYEPRLSLMPGEPLIP